MLEKIYQTKKIIYLRPLDMEMATGGCHENLLIDGKECKRFQSNCNNCPQLNSLNIFFKYNDPSHLHHTVNFKKILKFLI